MELHVEIELVAAEAYRGLIATRIRRGPGGSCTGNCPQTVPVAEDRPVRFLSESARLQGL